MSWNSSGGAAAPWPPPDLGLMALERLRLLDEVAYLRYASVYHDFQSAADFTAQIRNLQAGHPEPLVAIAASGPRRTRQRRATRRSGPAR